MNDVIRSSKEWSVDIDSILRFVKQSIFSKRRSFFQKLEALADGHLTDKTLKVKWPDALTVLTDEDWATALLEISDSVGLRNEPPAHETCEQLMSGLTESQREQATESLITIINVSSALEKKTPKELVDLVLGELAAMEVTSVQELLIEELCTRVHPNWCNEDSGKPNELKAKGGGT